MKNEIKKILELIDILEHYSKYTTIGELLVELKSELADKINIEYVTEPSEFVDSNYNEVAIPSTNEKFVIEEEKILDEISLNDLQDTFDMIRNDVTIKKIDID